MISIDDFYLKGLFASLILELCGAVIFMYRKADFFDEPEKSDEKPIVDIVEKTPVKIKENPSVEKPAKVISKPKRRDITENLSSLENVKPTTITVEEVINSINSAPPFQKKDVAEKYKGLVFEQVGYLNSVEKDWKDERKVRVNILLEQKSVIGKSIWFSTSLEQTPEIKVLQKGAAIKVRGKLISASGEGLSITLHPFDIDVCEAGTVA